MTFQRIVQALSLGLFILLPGWVAFPLVSPLPATDIFLRTDPLVLIGTMLSSRTFIMALWPAGVILLLTAVLGRFFCGCLCPMGTTVDLADRLIPARSDRPAPTLRRIRYRLLFFILGAGMMGISFVFLAAPLSLITRLYSLILYPALCFLADSGLTALTPVADRLGIPSVTYLQIGIPRFAHPWITLILFGGIFGCAKKSRRFWCRYLCPAGAIFALFSTKPMIRRQVSDACVECGQCRKACPMNAIGDNPRLTDHRECIACETCVRVCPTDAVTFSTGPARGASSFSGERRQLIRAGLSGAGAAIITATGLPFRRSDNAPGQIHPPELIRPPGALPERDFLSRCIRCGLCMRVCPTNTLQPIALASGVSAFLSPVITPRRGPCEPRCNACGQVCPTAAITPLTPAEKIWAKVGTAHVLRDKCLAWAFGRKCLVCDEVCPYNAIDLKTVPGISGAVPFVDAARCAGCGFCEHFCPVQAGAAIVVEPMEALRLAGGSYAEKGREIGLNLSITKKGKDDAQSYGGPESGTGESYGEGSGLPPGFTE
ncbi:4Fe-4S ferredoxin [Desulfonema ishimotonii]|uniref:4Fe-4S ferredoxin n=1 Tax=Desulfonema ishimotonii TaxID=45657 RepID=A0A401FX70_9BACT|nr:4Fe-4S binding protein [Desulfonema ishimotonii]GBC61577.1 4Fe-4S ferredoxin [Desulfonema ishimotonii]